MFQTISQGFFGMLKVQRTFSTVAPAVSGYYIAGQNEIIPLIHFALVVFFLHLSANVINDVSDYESDKINQPDRLFVSGVLSKKQVIVISVFLWIVGLIFALALDWIIFAVSATLGLFSWMVYNFGLKMKNRPIGSIFYLSLVTSTIPFLGGFIILRNINLISGVFAFFLSIFTYVVIINSLRDIPGDVIGKKRTLFAVLGIEKSRIFSIFIVIFPILVYPIISPLFGFLQTYLLYAVVPILVRLSIAFLLFKNDFSTSRYLMNILIVIDFTVLALAKPENGFSWLNL